MQTTVQLVKPSLLKQWRTVAEQDKARPAKQPPRIEGERLVAGAALSSEVEHTAGKGIPVLSTRRYGSDREQHGHTGLSKVDRSQEVAFL